MRAAADDARADAAIVAANAEVDALIAERARLDKDTSAGISDARAAEQVAASDVASISAEVIRLETRIARQETQAVRMPRGAFVFRVLAQEGQLVKQGDPLLELVPRATSPAVELWIDGNDAPLVSPGRRVRLQFEGWPALQFTGWPRAAVGSFGGVIAVVDAHDDSTGRFRVLVQPDPDDADRWPDPALLRQGVRVHGFILLEQVPLGFELWRRANAFPPTVPPTPPKTAKEKS